MGLSKKKVSINKKLRNQRGGGRKSIKGGNSGKNITRDMVSIKKNRGVETGIIKSIKNKTKLTKKGFIGNKWSPNNKSCGWFSYNDVPTYVGCPKGEFPSHEYGKKNIKFDGTCVLPRDGKYRFRNAYFKKHKITDLKEQAAGVPACKLTNKKLIREDDLFLEMPRGICLPIKDEQGHDVIKRYLTPDEIKFSKKKKLIYG